MQKKVKIQLLLKFYLVLYRKGEGHMSVKSKTKNIVSIVVTIIRNISINNNDSINKYVKNTSN